MKMNIRQIGIDDQYIIDLCITPEGGISHGRPSQINRKPEFHAVKEYLINRYDDIPEDQFTLNEVIYRIYRHIDTRPVCKVCGKPVKFYKPTLDPTKNKTYRETCSEKCRAKLALSTCQDTNMKRYGVKSNLQFEETQKKSNEMSRTPEAKQKKKETMLSRYGRELAFDTKESRTKAKKSSAQYNMDLKKNSDYMKNILRENPGSSIEDYINKPDFQIYVNAYLKSKARNEKISRARQKNNPNKSKFSSSQFIKKHNVITDNNDIFN